MALPKGSTLTPALAGSGSSTSTTSARSRTTKLRRESGWPAHSPSLTRLVPSACKRFAVRHSRGLSLTSLAACSPSSSSTSTSSSTTPGTSRWTTTSSRRCVPALSLALSTLTLRRAGGPFVQDRRAQRRLRQGAELLVRGAQPSTSRVLADPPHPNAGRTSRCRARRATWATLWSPTRACRRSTASAAWSL